MLNTSKVKQAWWKSDLLMLLPSLSLSPTAPDFWARSLPARSTRLILLTFSPDTLKQTHTRYYCYQKYTDWSNAIAKTPTLKITSNRDYRSYRKIWVVTAHLQDLKQSTQHLCISQMHNCNWGTCIALPTRRPERITESIRILVPVNRIKQKCFQITTKRVRR